MVLACHAGTRKSNNGQVTGEHASEENRVDVWLVQIATKLLLGNAGTYHAPARTRTCARRFRADDTLNSSLSA